MKTWLLALSLQAQALPLPGVPEVLHREYDFPAGERVIVQNTSGKITVSTHERFKIIIAATKKKGGDNCQLLTEKTDAVFVNVRSEKTDNSPCEFDIELRVPEKINLELNTSSGRIGVDGVSGDLNFSVGSGQVVAKGKFGRLEGKAGSADLDISGLVGEGFVDVGSGSVNLRFLDEAKGDFKVNTGSGDAVLMFPKDTAVNARLSAGTGSILNELRQNERADLKLKVTSGTGDLSVRAY